MTLGRSIDVPKGKQFIDLPIPMNNIKERKRDYYTVFICYLLPSLSNGSRNM